MVELNFSSMIDFFEVAPGQAINVNNRLTYIHTFYIQYIRSYMAHMRDSPIINLFSHNQSLGEFFLFFWWIEKVRKRILKSNGK